jgi:hypothetical protein
MESLRVESTTTTPSKAKLTKAKTPAAPRVKKSKDTLENVETIGTEPSGTKIQDIFADGSAFVHERVLRKFVSATSSKDKTQAILGFEGYNDLAVNFTEKAQNVKDVYTKVSKRYRDLVKKDDGPELKKRGPLSNETVGSDSE